MAEIEALTSERLMQYMRVLCKEIGPRPAASDKEKQAAAYVKRVLAASGITHIEAQKFRTQRTYGTVILPNMVLGMAAFLLGGIGGRRARVLAGLAGLYGTYATRQFLLGKAPFFRRLLMNGESQNVIALVPPRGEIRRRVYLIGHLDTNKQRFNAPFIYPALTKPLMTAGVFMAGLASLELLVRGMFGSHSGKSGDHPSPNRQGFSVLNALTLMLVGQSAISSAYDEAQPYIEGANDNATAVSVLLGIADALRENPLQHTEVALLFTGSEEVPVRGMEAYLQAYQPPKDNTYWIDLEMVGKGNICYVTKHGMSHFSEYRPHPEMLAIAARAAVKQPALAIAGKDMLILEEVACLAPDGYKAICVAGYDQQGFLPNWHRLSDKLENIEPETLSKAARYTWAVLQEVDAL